MSPVSRTSVKRHASCDECRRRKLKCSGDPAGCARCREEGIQCVFSEQKRMGRPRKPRPPADQQDPAPLNTGVDTKSSTHDMPTTASASVPQALIQGASSSDVRAYDPLRDDWPLPPCLTADAGYAEQDAAPCSCLASMYLNTDNLHAHGHEGFPLALAPIKQALSAAYDILECQECPLVYLRGRQNVLLLNALLAGIIHAFGSLYKSIEAESTRLRATGEKRSLRVGDNSTENMHLHTGTLNCPMGWNLDLDADAWETLATGTVDIELNGPDRPTSLHAVLHRFETRQVIWHKKQNELIGLKNPDGDNLDGRVCVRLARDLIRAMEAMIEASSRSAHQRA